MKSMILGLAFLMAASVSQADDSYVLPISRASSTVEMVAYNFWSGEYPGPVINVKSDQAGTTTVQAYKSLRQLDQPVACTIKNGLYHPWASPSSPTVFYTIAPNVKYVVKKDATLTYYPKNESVDMTVDLKVGDVLEREVYVGENYCSIAIPVKGVLTEVGIGCDATTDETVFQKVVGGGDTEQWLYVKCENGEKAFVRDQSLLAEPGVTEGQVIEYGTVGP